VAEQAAAMAKTASTAQTAFPIVPLEHTLAEMRNKNVRVVSLCTFSAVKFAGCNMAPPRPPLDARATIGWLVAAAFGVAAACSLLLAVTRGRDVDKLQLELDQERRKRRDEQLGRTKAERELREESRVAQADQDFPCAVIGVLESAFRTRNGTPRQGNVAPTNITALSFGDRHTNPRQS